MKKIVLLLTLALVISLGCVSIPAEQPAAKPSTPAPADTTPAATSPTAGTAPAAADTTPSFNLPEVKSFSVKPVNTVRDYPATLKWDVANATDVVIEPNIGIVPASGSKDFTTPFGTTNYKLTATNAQGSIIATTTLTISGDLPGRDTPVVTQFTASPYVIKKGQSSRLTWKTIAASAVTIDGKTVAADGSIVVTPDETSTYNIVATSSDGTMYQTVTVNVK